MGEQEKPKDKKRSLASIEDLVSKKYELEKQIEDLREDVTILFSDIVGYSRFTHEHGDVAGRMIMARHTKVFEPYLGQYNGVYVKSIGDAVMIRFENPSAAVDVACAVLRDLDAENKDLPKGKQLHLRIGVATGKGLIEEGDVNGEVVNISARLCKMADVDGLMIAEKTVERLDMYLQGLCILDADKIVRGVEADSPKVFRVCWNPKTPARPRRESTEALVLEVNIENENLKLSLTSEGGDLETVSHYEYIPWKKTVVDEACHRITQAFKRSTLGKTEGIGEEIRSAGGILYDVLLSSRIKETLDRTRTEELILKIQDSLVSIPWELLYDGKEYFCIRFAMGRRVASRLQVQKAQPMWSLRPKISIISDPRGNLPAANQEGRDLAERLGASERIRVAMKSQADSGYIRRALRDSQLIHFCGHADYVDERPEDSGLALFDGKLTGRDVLQMAESHQSMPMVIFANACQSGRSEEWAELAQDRIYGLASAFLHAGIQHYIGTFTDVLDTPSREFAAKFYESVLAGNRIGRALRYARTELKEKLGESNLVWASYMLYGDPTLTVFGVPVEEEKIHHEATPSHQEPKLQEVKSAEGQAVSIDELMNEPAGAGAGAEETGEPRRTARASDALAMPKKFSWNVVVGFFIAFLAVIGLWYLLNKPMTPQPSASQGPPDPSDRIAFLNYLGERMNSREYLEKRKNEDPWTSRPLSVAILPFETRGEADAGSPLYGTLYEAVYDQLSAVPGVQVVERKEINRVMEELNLGSSDLVRGDMVARMGELLFARFIGFGELTQEGDEQLFSFRVVETETTRIISRKFRSGEEVTAEGVREMADEIGMELKEEMPIQGRIIEVSGKSLYLNVGAREGVKEGQVYEVIDEKEIAPGRVITEKVGTVKITQVDDAAAVGEVQNVQKELVKEDKVKIKEEES